MNIWSTARVVDDLACGVPFWDLPDWRPAPVRPDRPVPPPPEN